MLVSTSCATSRSPHDFAEACDLVARTRRQDRLFAIAHGYSAYPMTRYARIARARRHAGRHPAGAGRIHPVRHGDPRRGRAAETIASSGYSIPKRSGLALVMSAIGCHAQQLACATVGKNIARVVRRRCRAVARAQGHRLRFCAARIRRRRARNLHRDAGGRGRRERHPPARLRRARHARLVASRRELPAPRAAGRAARIVGRGDTFLPPEIIACGRTPRGHPEGLREAFANIYAEVAQERMARALGEPVAGISVSAHRGRRAHHGVHRGLSRVAGQGRVGRRARRSVAPEPGRHILSKWEFAMREHRSRDAHLCAMAMISVVGAGRSAGRSAPARSAEGRPAHVRQFPGLRQGAARRSRRRAKAVRAGSQRKHRRRAGAARRRQHAFILVRRRQAHRAERQSAARRSAAGPAAIRRASRSPTSI